MSLFEAQVRQIRALLAGAACVSLAPAPGPLPEARAHAGLILQNETLCELGGPARTGVLTLAYTNAPGRDGAYRIGAELSDLKGSGADFALALVVSGKRLDAETFYRLALRFPRLADHPGWMVKTDKSMLWIRVGGDDPEGKLETAAACLVARIREAFDAVEGVELYFVIGDGPLIARLRQTADESLALMHELKTGVWKERGFDYASCALAGHCGNCSDKRTCAGVRAMQAKVRMIRREKDKRKEQQSCTK